MGALCWTWGLWFTPQPPFFVLTPRNFTPRGGQLHTNYRISGTLVGSRPPPTVCDTQQSPRGLPNSTPPRSPPKLGGASPDGLTDLFFTIPWAQRHVGNQEEPSHVGSPPSTK